MVAGPPALTVRVFDDDNTGAEEVGVGTLPLSAGWESMVPLDTQVRSTAALWHAPWQHRGEHPCHLSPVMVCK